MAIERNFRAMNKKSAGLFVKERGIFDPKKIWYILSKESN